MPLSLEGRIEKRKKKGRRKGCRKGDNQIQKLENVCGVLTIHSLLSPLVMNSWDFATGKITKVPASSAHIYTTAYDRPFHDFWTRQQQQQRRDFTSSQPPLTMGSRMQFHQRGRVSVSDAYTTPSTQTMAPSPPGEQRQGYKNHRSRKQRASYHAEFVRSSSTSSLSSSDTPRRSLSPIEMNHFQRHCVSDAAFEIAESAEPCENMALPVMGDVECLERGKASLAHVYSSH